MRTSSRFLPAGLLLGSVGLLLSSTPVGAQGEAEPLVGNWSLAAAQRNPEFAARIEPLGEMVITATHVIAFGEA